jgi:hypothetical protein
VTAIILIVVAAAVIIGLSLAFGGPLIGAIIAAVVIVGIIVWLVAASGSGRTPSEVTREVPEPELLGPGGPDDPRS